MKTQKITPTLFKKITEEIVSLSYLEYEYQRDQEDKIKYSDVEKAAVRIEELKELIKDVETVNVQYYIGYRRYYGLCYKVGKSLYRFTRYEKLLKKNAPSIIPEITQDMRDQMMDDSYYY